MSRKVRLIQNSMTSGELDPALRARGDVKHYFNGLDKARNVLAFPQGGVVRRPGLRYVDELPRVIEIVSTSGWGVTAPQGGTAANLFGPGSITTTNNLDTADPFVVAQVDALTSQQFKFIDVGPMRVVNAAWSASSTALADQVYLEGSNDAAAWTEIGEPFSAVHQWDGTGTDWRDSRRRFTPTAAYRYYRVVRKGTAPSGFGFPLLLASIGFYNETATLSNVKVVPFQFSADQHYLIVFTDKNARVYRDGVAQTDIEAFYDSDELPNLNWTQSLDTLLLFHPSHNVIDFVREGDHDQWNWIYRNFDNINLGGASDTTVANTTAGTGQAKWRAGTFFQGRLWLVGGITGPQSVWASKSGDFKDFDISGSGADRGIVVDADTDDVSIFNNIYAGRHLTIFSDNGEFYVPVSADTVLTADNIVLRRTTRVGSKEGLRVIEVDGALMFVQGSSQADGTVKGSSLREFIFVDTQQAYEANNVSLLSSHFLTDVRSLAYRKQTATDESDYILCPNTDGSLAVFCTLRTQQVAAWTRCDTDGKFLAVGVDREEMYFGTERTINSVVRRFLEVFDTDLEVDCAVKDMALGGDTTSATVTHLDGETVDVIVDDILDDPKTVSGGSVTFSFTGTASYQVGLAFPDVTQYFDTGDPQKDTGEQVFVRDMPPEIALDDGTMVGVKKRVVNGTLLLRDTRHARVNGKALSFRSKGSTLLGDAIPLFNGEKRTGSILGWTLTGQMWVSQSKSLPMKLLGIAKKVAFNG